MKTGIIIGRFQTPFLTKGHLHLIKEASKLVDKIVIVIGESPTKATNKHPLDFKVRQGLFKHLKLETIRLNDSADDKVWSNNLDKIAKNYENPIYICGRDGFKQFYKGEIETKEIESLDNYSATQIRKIIGTEVLDSEDFRKGIIYATENKFPTVYQTVDIAVLNKTNSSCEILLGKKPNTNWWCLMGGFVDPSDQSLEEAARRELKEEVLHMDVYPIRYIGSSKIDDWRYKGTSDSVMTSLFVTYFAGGNPQAGDDIEKVKWFTFEKAKAAIGVHHKDLLEKIINLYK